MVCIQARKQTWRAISPQSYKLQHYNCIIPPPVPPPPPCTCNASIIIVWKKMMTHHDVLIAYKILRLFYVILLLHTSRIQAYITFLNTKWNVHVMFMWTHDLALESANCVCVSMCWLCACCLSVSESLRYTMYTYSVKSVHAEEGLIVSPLCACLFECLRYTMYMYSVNSVHCRRRVLIVKFCPPHPTPLLSAPGAISLSKLITIIH